MKVLIIQQKMIGDVLTSSILFECIKTAYPKSELHYLINTHTYPVVKGNPFIDEFKFFTPTHEGSTWELWKFAKALRHEDYDIIIDVYSIFSSNLICLLSRAKTKISKYKWYSSFIYDITFRELKSPKTNAGLAIENRLMFLKAIDIKTPEPVKPKIYLTDKERQSAKEFLETNALDLSKPLFMIGVLGSGESKTYPFKYMAELLDTIVDVSEHCQIVFNYIPKQIDQAKSIYNQCSSQTKKQIHFEVFGASLREFLAITSHCTALIGNEGGATNMAKALSVPTYTIFSPWIIKEAWNMFDDGENHVSVHLNDYRPELFSGKSSKEQMKNWSALYQHFEPRFFKESLKRFVLHVQYK